MLEMNAQSRVIASSEMGSSLRQADGNPLGRRARLDFFNSTFRIVCVSAAVFVCLVLFGILLLMFKTGMMTFQDVSLKTFFLSTNWDPENGQFGALLFIFGTFALTALTLVLSVPISLLIAIFLAEITPSWLRGMLRPVMDLLVGIPSVVYGYLGLTMLVPMLRGLTGRDLADGLLAAAIVLAIMVLPTIARISDDAISAVPKKYRDASYGLGSTRFQTIFRVVLPAAKRGIVYAVILGMTRALGETMAVVMVIGNTPQLADSLFTPTAVLTSNIVMQITSVEADSTWNYALYLMGFLLLAISLLLIVAVRLLQKRGEKAL